MPEKTQRPRTLKAIAINGLLTLALSWSVFVCIWEWLGIWQYSRFSSYRSEMVAGAGAILGTLAIFFIVRKVRFRHDARFRKRPPDAP